MLIGGISIFRLDQGLDMADGEIFEGEGEGTVKFTEDLFDDMQKALQKLVRSYEVC